MGFTQPKCRKRPKDSVNPVLTERSGATDLYHGSRLKKTHKKTNHCLDGSHIHLLGDGCETYSPQIEQSDWMV